MTWYELFILSLNLLALGPCLAAWWVARPTRWWGRELEVLVWGMWSAAILIHLRLVANVVYGQLNPSVPLEAQVTSVVIGPPTTALEWYMAFMTFRYMRGRVWRAAPGHPEPPTAKRNRNED